jgi:hypothetical protein
MPRALRIARFVVIQLVLLLLVVEVALRVLRTRNQSLEVLLYLPSVASEFDRIETLPELLETTIIGFRPHEQIAGFVRNSRGFRTPEYAEEKPEGVTRIVLLGDSFTFSSGGIPWSDSWTVRLETRLREGRPDRIECVNLGVEGVGPLFERRLWQLEGRKLDADVVLLALFVGNDFTDHYRPPAPSSPLDAAARRSYTFRLVRNLGRVLGERGAELAVAPVLDVSGGRSGKGGYELPAYREAFRKRKPLYSPERLLEIESQRMRLCDRGQSEAFDELFDRLAGVLRDLAREVEADGADFCVVVLPDRFQVNRDERDAALALLRMLPTQFEWDKPQERLRAFFEAEGIRSLDLLPAFRAVSPPEQLFEPGDTHWNLRGNAFAGDEIARWLAPLLPPAAR